MHGEHTAGCAHHCQEAGVDIGVLGRGRVEKALWADRRGKAGVGVFGKGGRDEVPMNGRMPPPLAMRRLWTAAQILQDCRRNFSENTLARKGKSAAERRSRIGNND